MAMAANPADRAPNKVLLFSGHMIDAPGRDKPRFPPSQESAARLAIVALLAQLAPGPQDSAVCSGACGGDLLFAEAALERGLSLEIYLPFETDVFATKSVDFAGASWHARFKAACAAASLHLMPHERGPLAPGEDPYEQNNLWMLEAASRFGTEKVDFICLWNGQGGDGPGGTQHLMQEVGRRHGHTHWLDTTQLWK
jgi:hypothetical protein